jgi:phosphoribosylamine--glycine ligase
VQISNRLGKVLILVIGQGAREHAITHTLLQDPNVEVVCAPGNPGIAQIAKIASVDINDTPAVVELARKHKPDLVVVAGYNDFQYHGTIERVHVHYVSGEVGLKPHTVRSV